MKYIVGYPIEKNEAYLDEIAKRKSFVSEVYFSFVGVPNGRSSVLAEGSSITAIEQMRQIEDLKRLSGEGIKLNMLFNANCYGRESQSRSFFYRIGNIIELFKRECNLSSVTTSSPLIAKFVKANFEGLDVRASVNMEIGTPEGFSYVSELFDSFYIKREMNRNIAALMRMRSWCDENGKEMYLLANSGCLNDCSAHIFHDNLVAHEAEISEMDNGYQFTGVCRDFLSRKENFYKWLERTNFIRPEDIPLYEKITPAMKLATRVNPSPIRILRAYTEMRYRGAITELLEPDHTGLFYPDYIENVNIARDFAARVLSCDKSCVTCGFCREVMREACVNLGEDTSKKV